MEKFNVEKVGLESDPGESELRVDVPGYRCFREAGIRQKIRNDLACHCRSQLWFLCDPRDAALYILLPGPNRVLNIQVFPR